MQTPPGSRLLPLAPHTLGESAGLGGHLTAAFDPAARRWQVEWLDQVGAAVRAECAVGGNAWTKPIRVSNRTRGAATAAGEANPPGLLACVRHETGRVALRSGRRVVGTPPQFPSASLVLCAEDAGAWRDLGFADEAPEKEIGPVALAVAPDFLLAAYFVGDDRGHSVCRVVQWPRAVAKASVENWRKLPPYPQAPGMAGLMAAMHDGVLLAAGGANFPDRPPWDGGMKKFYDEIYALLPGASAWISAGRLPAPRAYGATVALPDGVLVVGGENGGEVFSDTLRLRWNGRAVEVVAGPSLPAPVTCAAAAVLDGCVYVGGGYSAGTPRVSRDFFWRLDATRPSAKFEALPAWPGPTRALAVAAAVEGAFYFISGIEVGRHATPEIPGVYLKDAFRFRPGAGWARLPDLPWSAIAAASPAPLTTNPPRVFVLGGVDGRQVGQLPRATQVPHDILCFDVARAAWRLWPERWPHSVVCASAIAAGPEWIIPSGETMAGKRTTEVWAWRIAG